MPDEDSRGSRVRIPTGPFAPANVPVWVLNELADARSFAVPTGPFASANVPVSVLGGQRPACGPDGPVFIDIQETGPEGFERRRRPTRREDTSSEPTTCGSAGEPQVLRNLPV